MAYSPKDPATLTSWEELRDWASDEFGYLSQHVMEQTKVLELTPLARNIDRPREGNIIHADGTNFDPGGGKGPYSRINDVWVPLADWGYPNVRTLTSFGAKGVGGDDTAAFNAAFTWLNAGSRTLLIPPGAYGKTGTHTITANGVSIIGLGGLRNGVEIRQLDDLDSIVATAVDPVSGFNVGFSMRSLEIRRTNGTTVTNGIDLRLINCFHVLLADLNISNSVRGLHILGGNGGFIYNVQVVQNQDISSAVSGSALVKIGSTNNSGAAAHIPSFSFKDLKTIAISGSNYIEYGIQITGCDGLFFDGCYFGGGTKTYDFYIEPSALTGDVISSVSVSNTMFDGYGGTSNGVHVNSGNAGRTVKWLRFDGCESVSHSSGSGMVFEYPMDQGSISNCALAENSGYGLLLNGSTGTTNTIIVGNNFKSNTTADLGGNALNNATTTVDANNIDLASVQTTPTVTSGTGSFTTVASTVNKRQKGKYVYFDGNIAITTNGTAGTFIKIVSFGTTPLRNTAVHGYCPELGVGIEGRLDTGGVLSLFRADGNFPTDGANGRNVHFEGFCEVA